MKTKVCRKCKESKPPDQFGRNTWFLVHGVQDGLNTICKECVRSSAAAKRATLPKKGRLPRRPRVGQPQIETVEVNRPKVLGAILSGHKSREAIEEHTGLSMDEVVDALADLAFETRELRIIRKGERREFHLAA